MRSILNRISQALAGKSARHATTPTPEYRAHIASGLEKLAAKSLSAALNDFDEAVALQPNIAVGHANRATTLFLLGRSEEAIHAYERCIELDPGFADAYRNRGIILGRSGRLQEGVESIDRAIQLNPADYLAVFERGYLLVRMKRLAEGEADMDRVIAMSPEYAPAYGNKAICMLLAGNFEQGLPLFEWRWKHTGADPSRALPGAEVWLGDRPIGGKRILVFPEQGYGDVIQFCRYVPVLERMGAIVVLSTPAPLARLLRSLSPSVTVVEQGQPIPACDYACSVVSLPFALRTTVGSIPGSTPYLSVDAALKQAWADRIGPRNRARVGLCWSGNPSHEDDANRSIPIDMLRPILELPVEFHVIQRETPADRARLALFPNVRIHQLEDFADTGALIEAMDLVISVDTAPAHVAGALARPLWVLLPFMPDWRWMLDRTDSPWYPTAELFRQPSYRDWPTVIALVREKLLAYT